MEACHQSDVFVSLKQKELKNENQWKSGACDRCGARERAWHCLAYGKGGGDIAVVDINTDTTGDVAAEIEEPGRKATTFRTDVSDRAEVYAAVEHAEKTVGGLDIMVNNAGIAQVDPIADVTPEDVKLILKINIQGGLRGIQAAAAKFKSLGHKGKIINVSSIAGHDGYETQGVCSATTFAVRALTQAAAREYASDGVSVNADCPGIVGTDMWVGIDRQFSELTGPHIDEIYGK
ncbi:meso-butanediol dehydrogenase / (S,S)-butanediol dehydrogenase / diacetyl reductase [Roseovarius marisflavi]|uniref:Meso-butanediol dehydrogenase / (S,S)-butanediol dehydrogenase / diacetyl reductase n=1 Tax=Roseovarius marisflavi TaxID=1054996 RepID=A0A1M7DDN2_9RHOB|nr:meso-butanediol dehydrogenase / (S,S)-butanediol dehydrogenase / diacetyl reductase [Roseovarius marisflavi]